MCSLKLDFYCVRKIRRAVSGGRTWQKTQYILADEIKKNGFNYNEYNVMAQWNGIESLEGPETEMYAVYDNDQKQREKMGFSSKVVGKRA